MQHITSSMEDNGGSQVSTTIPAFVANKEGAEPALGESHVGKSLAADASREPVPGKQINLKDQGPLDLSTSPLNRSVFLQPLHLEYVTVAENKRGSLNICVI